MSFPSATRAPRRPVRGRRGALMPTLVVLGALLLVLGIAANVWTELLWFNQLDYGQVYTTRVLTQIALFVLGALLMAAAVGASMSLAYRSRPVYAPVDEQQQNLDRYRESLEPLRRLVLIALPAGLGLFAGSAASQQWQTVLIWLNRTPFGVEDPEFGLDIGFYTFTLPFLRFVVGFLTAVLVLSLIVAAATHYLYGGLRIQGRGPRTTRFARVQLALLLGLLLLTQAVSYWLDRYSLLVQEGYGDFITGGTYTSINAVLPARQILSIIAVVVALLFFATMVRGGWRLPTYGIALMVISAVAIGGIFPAAVQRFQVQPSPLTRERDYIERAIAATRTAYGLDDVEVQGYEPQDTGERGALAQDATTTASIRLLDPQLVSPAFRQLERNKQYYNFADSLDVDRYTIDGQSRDTVIAVRELDQNGIPAAQRNWLSDHAIYTHGFGVVAAYGNERNDDGEPSFFQLGIPSEGELDLEQPRIYFGEQSPEYSIVGAPDGADPQELDFPTDAEGGTGQAQNTFSGDGGPGVGSLVNRLLYAIKFQDQNILLSDAVNSESQILYDRDPRERVEKVAPFLTMDGDPYPAVIGGEVVWILDGYTTSDAYPYSSREELGEATVDSVTAQNAAVRVEGEVNYIRNSVKATVNAYDGSVTLYSWDDEDPILQTWTKIFPDAVQPMSEIDAELMSHLRYPEDLFKVQRELLARYHVTDAPGFFSGQDYWQTPADPTSGAADGVDQPPYYLTLQMPGQDAPSFSLTSTYIPRSAEGQNGSNVLTGFLAVDADAGSEAGERAESYGTLRLLELPRNEPVAGPGQVQNDFNSSEAQQDLNILRNGNSSRVTNGNLLTLPVGGGLLYVQPVYVQSQTETSFPLLRFVLVAFGGDIGFAPTLDAALDQVFGGDSGATAGDADAGGVVDPANPGVPVTPGADDAEARLDQALTEANQAIQAGQAALAEGDFTAYGQTQADLRAALTRAIEARAEITGVTPADGAAAEGTDAATPAP